MIYWYFFFIGLRDISVSKFQLKIIIAGWFWISVLKDGLFITRLDRDLMNEGDLGSLLYSIIVVQPNTMTSSSPFILFLILGSPSYTKHPLNDNAIDASWPYFLLHFDNPKWCRWLNNSLRITIQRGIESRTSLAL